MPFIVSAVTAIAGAISGVLAAGGIGAALVRLGGTLLLSYASQALMPKPKVALQARTVTVREPVVPRDMVYGRARKGGVITFLHASGAKDQFLHLVIVLAAHRVKSIGAIWFDGEMAISAGGIVQGRWSGKITVEKRLGAEEQAAFASLMANVPTKWTAAHRLAGCAALYLRLTYDADAFPGGIPNITVDIEGKDDILDPRTGLRVYSENPALCLADYLAHPAFGIGAGIGAADGIEVESLIEAANICDEMVPLASGGSERRYACNGVVSLAESPKTIIEGLLSAMAGRVAVQGGSWRIHAGAYRLPEVTLTADDVRAGGLVLATRVSQSANFNGVRGQFVSPENDWQPDDFPAYASDVYLAEDGGERKWRDLSLPFTISAAMAQRLAKIELERARRQMTVKLSGKLAAWRAGVGETVMLSYARWGFAAKPFEVQGVSLDLTASGDGALLLPELVLRESSPLVYDWSASEEAIYAAAPRTTLPGPADVPAPGTPHLAEEMYETRGGTGVRVLIRVSWIEAPSDFVREYQIRARRILDKDGLPTGEDWITLGRTDQTSWEIRDVKPGRWEVAVKSLSVIGVSSPYVSADIEILGLTAPPAALWVCNGCTDDSAKMIRCLAGPAAEVIELARPGKTTALQAGDDALGGLFPRLYLDADTWLRPGDIARLMQPLLSGSVDLVAPRLRFDVAGASGIAARIGACWLSLPHAQTTAFSNAIGLSSAARALWGKWPKITGDDAFVSAIVAAHMNPLRKQIIDTALATISMPRSFNGWVQMRARWLQGEAELARLGFSPPRPVRQRSSLLCQLVFPATALGAWAFLVARALAKVTRADTTTSAWMPDRMTDVERFW